MEGGNVSREHMIDFFGWFRETIFELLAKYTHTDKDTVFVLSIHFNVHKAVDMVSRRAKQMKSLYSRQLSAFSELGVSVREITRLFNSRGVNR